MKKIYVLIVLCLTLGTNVIFAANTKEASPYDEKPFKGLYFSLWGSIGDSDDIDFVMNGATGFYTYNRKGQQAIKRTLKLSSYNRSTGKLILNAYLKEKYIGKFDGIFKEEHVNIGNGEYKYITVYSGEFISIKGIRLKFYLYCD